MIQLYLLLLIEEERDRFLNSWSIDPCNYDSKLENVCESLWGEVFNDMQRTRASIETLNQVIDTLDKYYQP